MKFSLFGLAILLTGCFETPIQTMGVTSSSTRMREVKTKLADNGVTTGRIDPNSTSTQMVSVPEGSTVAGSSLMVPPGALAVAADILIESAMPLATDTGIAELAIDATVARTGVPVSIQASEMIDAKTPMTISLPLPLGLRLSEIKDANIAVMYRVAQNEAGKNMAGIIPRSQLTITGNTVIVTTRFFGAFQVVEFSAPLEAIEVQVVTPSFTQSNVALLPALELSSLSEIVAQSGKRIQIYGKNFRSSMVIAMGGKLVKDLKIASESVASFIVPTAAAAGRVYLSGAQDGITQTVPLFFLPGAEDLPIITLAAADVCSGTRYYDRAGSIQTGVKICSGTTAATVAASDLRAGVVVGSVTGTMSVPNSCANDGETGCLVQGPSMAAAVTSGLASKVLFGFTVAGVSGSASVNATSCSASGAVGCLTVTDFPAVDKSYLTSNASKISSQINIAGVAGTLMDCSSDGNTNCRTTAMYPSVDFGSIDFMSVRGTTTIGGTPGSMMDCAADGQQNCYPTGVWKAANPSIYTPWDIRSGKQIAGVIGKIDFYRNGANLTLFNETAIGSADTSTVAADNYDSIDDDNGSTDLPSLVPTGGPKAVPASAANRPIKLDSTFETIANGICDVSEDCVYKDQMTGLRWHYTDLSLDFSAAATSCLNLSIGSLTSGWRLPSQKELQMAYINGIWGIGLQMAWTNLDYWTATTASYDFTRAYHMTLSDGTVDVSLKSAGPSHNTLCVHNP